MGWRLWPGWYRAGNRRYHLRWRVISAETAVSRIEQAYLVSAGLAEIIAAAYLKGGGVAVAAAAQRVNGGSARNGAACGIYQQAAQHQRRKWPAGWRNGKWQWHENWRSNTAKSSRQWRIALAAKK